MSIGIDLGIVTPLIYWGIFKYLFVEIAFEEVIFKSRFIVCMATACSASFPLPSFAFYVFLIISLWDASMGRVDCCCLKLHLFHVEKLWTVKCWVSIVDGIQDSDLKKYVIVAVVLINLFNVWSIKKDFFNTTFNYRQAG